MTLLRPTSLADATRLLADGGGLLLAGGTDIYPALVDRPPPPRMIDLGGLPELSRIDTAANGHHIGSGMTWTQLINAQLPRGFDALVAAAREIGGWQIQNRATIGGNLCNASPAADSVPPLLALDAEVELQNEAGSRRLPLDRFLLGNRKTARRPDEVLTAVVIPETLAEASSVFLKLGARRHLVISIAMVAVTISANAGGRVTAARIVVGSAAAVASRLHGLERRLQGLPLARLADIRPDPSDLAVLSPIDDIRASASYRTAAAAVLVSRAIAQAAVKAATHVG
jgi:CO/xanthine dehydrogenase FAD-binding subunit